VQTNLDCLFKIIVSEQSDALSKSVRLHTGILIVRQFITVVHRTMVTIYFILNFNFYLSLSIEIHPTQKPANKYNKSR